MTCLRCPCLECRKERGALTPYEVAIEEEVDRLRCLCASKGEWISWDGERVHEETAAKILGREPSTLRNKRSRGESLPFHKPADGRVTYRLRDLAIAQLAALRAA